MRDRECVEFLQWALPRLGLRWPGFRKVRRQVCQRLTRRLADLGLRDLERYRARLEADEREWSALDRLCRITISRFFRDRGVWVELERAVLPELARRAREHDRNKIHAWSAGCASGEEPYSLAILWQRSLASRFRHADLDILATDVDLTLLARARRGVYPASALREADILGHRDAFTPTSGEEWRLGDDYRSPVRLVALDVRSDAPEETFDLIFCRNLAFTYFAPALKRQVLDRLAARLVPGGVLVIGSHESLPEVERGRPSSGLLITTSGIFRVSTDRT